MSMSRLEILERVAENERIALANAGAVQKLTVHEKALLFRVEDAVGAIGDWPAKTVKTFLCTHLLKGDRFSLTLFLLANRCPPPLIAEWYLRRRMLHDLSAREHVANIIADHRSGKLERDGRTAYVLGATLRNGDPAPFEERIWPVYAPDFARDWKFGYWWQEAIAMLKSGSLTAVGPPC